MGVALYERGAPRAIHAGCPIVWRLERWMYAGCGVVDVPPPFIMPMPEIYRGTMTGVPWARENLTLGTKWGYINAD